MQCADKPFIINYCIPAEKQIIPYLLTFMTGPWFLTPGKNCQKDAIGFSIEAIIWSITY